MRTSTVVSILVIILGGVLLTVSAVVSGVDFLGDSNFAMNVIMFRENPLLSTIGAITFFSGFISVALSLTARHR